MFVLESSGSDPWESEYSMKGELDTFDQFAIDGTYFKFLGELYHIYRCVRNENGRVMIKKLT
jgi:GH43 family beta-xylosidase